MQRVSSNGLHGVEERRGIGLEVQLRFFHLTTQHFSAKYILGYLIEASNGHCAGKRRPVASALAGRHRLSFYLSHSSSDTISDRRRVLVATRERRFEDVAEQSSTQSHGLDLSHRLAEMEKTDVPFSRLAKDRHQPVCRHFP